MKLAKRIKKAIVVLLCTSIVMTNVLPSFAEGNNESEPAIEEVVENEAEEAIEEIVEGNSENIEEELEESPEDIEEEPKDEFEEEPEEDLSEEVEDIPEDVEEENISSPSEITDEENEEENETPVDMVDEPEEDEIIDEPEELMFLGSVASPSDTEEVEEETEIDEEVEEASPSELEMDMPMLLGAPLFGAPGPNDECQIGSDYYEDLHDAISAVNNGETIVMIKNVTYDTPFIIDTGKTFTIDFMDGSTQHTFKWYDFMGEQSDKDVFTIKGNSKVTVKNMKYTVGMGEVDNRVFRVESTGTLTLDNMTAGGSDNNYDTIVYNDGGTATVIGGNISTTTASTNYGLFVNDNGGTLTIKGNGTYTENSTAGVPIFYLGDDSSAEHDAGDLIIENGTFNGMMGIRFYGKANATIEDGNFNTQGAFVVPANGVKSEIIIENITANCSIGFLVEQAQLENKVDFQDGSVVYQPGWFCINTGVAVPTATTDIIITKGKFGPTTGFAEYTQDEISNLMAPGSEIVPYPTGTTYKFEVTAASPVCKIGSTGYATLEAAITDATSGQTITMISDISYTNGTDFIIDGKTVTIDFDCHSITVNVSGIPTETKIFSIINSGNLTIKDSTLIFVGMGLKPFTVSGSGSKLALNNVTQANNLNNFLTLDGGTATINGGTFGTSSDSIGIKPTNNATLKITNNPTFNYQLSLITISNTNPDTLTANVTIDSGTFNGAGTTRIIELNAKANITLNGGTFTSSSAQSTPILIKNYGYKSSMTINNFTSDSPYVFRSENTSNIESFTANINNGHFKYTKGQFAVDVNNSLKPNIKLNGGFYGPDTADDDALAELTALLVSENEIQTLSSSDSEYASGYRYKVVQPAPPTYTVIFDAKGGLPVPSAQTIISGNKVTKPTTNPTKSGYTFICWSIDDDPNTENSYNFDSLVTMDMTLYAKWKVKSTPPSGGGGSSGGSGGGSAGLPRYDSLGNIIGPGGIQNYTYDGTNPPNLTGNIKVSSWNYATGTPQANSVKYVQNTDSFVRADNTPVVTEWVGVTTNDIGKVMWYRTDATGKILKNQFIQIGTNIYYLDNNGIMATGQVTINGKVYNFDTTAGATEGRLLY